MSCDERGVPETRLVLHIITGLGEGGAERQLSALARASTDRSFRHAVVSLTDEGIHGEDIRRSGVELTCLGIARGRISLSGFVALTGLIRRRRPALVQTWLYHADLAGIFAAALGGFPPVMWTLRCSDMDLSRYGRLTSGVVSLAAKLSSLPVAIVANSHSGMEAHRVMGYRPRIGRIIPNGIDTDRYRPNPAARAAARRELGFDEKAPVVGLIARLDPMKDHETFLAAAEMLMERRSDVRFLLVGRGVDVDPTIRAFAERHGRLIALGPRRDIARIMAALDLCCLSSAFGEGYPNVLGEAMACGVPCVATDVGDAARIVGDTGRVVPPRDPPSLAEATRFLLSEAPAEREERSAAARRRIVENYGLTAMVDAYHELYEELIGLNGPRARRYRGDGD